MQANHRAQDGSATTEGSVEQRSAGIDVMRGLCALLVVLHHIHLRFRLNHFDAQGVGRTALTRGTGFIRMVGRSSYELYMTHMLIVLAPMPLIVAWQPDRQLIPLLYLGMLMLSIVLGWIIHEFFSEPLNRALRGSLSRR